MGFRLTGIYTIKIGDAAAKQWVQFSYEFTLNGMSNGQIVLDGVTGGYLTEFDVDEEIYIYKSGTQVFRGIITDQNSLTNGGIILTYQGIEIELTDDKVPMTGSEVVRSWTSTSDNTIFNTLVTSITGWTTNVTNSTSTTVPSFRASATESVWNAVIRLIEQTGKDIWVDQLNKVLYLYDELTNDNQFSFIEGKNARNISRKKSRSKAGKVIVLGKGDGEYQIRGSFGSGTPVETIIDRNIITTDEADDRAESAYNRLNPQPKHYVLEPIIINGTLTVGDSGIIANNSASINETVDIVRIKTLINNVGAEQITMEVANPDLRLATKNEAEERNKSEANYQQSQTSMQGSGNTLSWSAGINANSSAPLRRVFYLSPDQVQDEAGNLRIDTLTVDYDVDPFREDAGISSESNIAPSLSAGNTDSHKHDAADSGHTHSVTSPTSDTATLYTNEGSVTWSENISSGAFDYVAKVNVNGTFAHLLCVVEIENDGWSGNDYVGFEIKGLGITTIVTNSLYYSTAYNNGINRLTYVVPVFACLSNVDIELSMYSVNNSNYQGEFTVYSFDSSHTHTITAITSTQSAIAAVDDDNKSPGLAGNAGSHNHSVTIGDGVDDAASLNATQVSIYLDYWNTGTSTWDNKHSILNTGNTLDTDVDITNSGAYPDATGFWRIRIYTDNASSDYVQAVVKTKHQLDN